MNELTISATITMLSLALATGLYMALKDQQEQFEDEKIRQHGG